MMYKIYHIPSVKIGVSINPKKRVKQQGYSDYEILEDHTDVYEVSIREQQLQRQYGYKVDTKPYWKTIKMPTFQSRSKGGKIGGKTNAESGQLAKISALGGKFPSNYHIQSGHMERMRKKSIEVNKRPILQYDRDGKFIKEWDSIKECAIALGLHDSALNLVLKGKRNHTGGFVFKYKK